MPQGKGYKDYDSAGKKKSIAKRLGKAAIEVAANPMGYSKMMNAPKAPPRAKTKPQSKRRPGEAPSTIAGRTARTAPVKKAGGGSSSVKPRKKSTGSAGPLAGRSPAMSPKKKSGAGKGAAQKKAASKARLVSVDKVDAGRRRTQVAVRRGAAKKAAARTVAMATEKKRDRAASRNRRYKDDRAYRD